VVQPDRRRSTVTNTFNFRLSFDLQRDADGRWLSPRRVLPDGAEQAMDMVRRYGTQGG
jgi:hypothetical protein